MTIKPSIIFFFFLTLEDRLYFWAQRLQQKGFPVMAI